MHDLDHAVPLTVFTDAGPFSLQRSCVVTSFSSLLTQGHEKVSEGSCVKRSGGQVDIPRQVCQVAAARPRCEMAA